MSQQNEIDELIINLKILAKLEQNKKLMAKESLLNIETESFIPENIRRRYRGDSRDVTIKKIDEIIVKSIIFTNENKFDFKSYIMNSLSGIKNLSKTYSDCPKTQARLSTIMDKINMFDQEFQENVLSDNSDFE